VINECAFVPKRYPPRPFHQNRLVLLIKPSQNLLSSQFRQQLLDIIVESDQATLDDLQRGDRSQQLSLRSEQEDGVIFDIGRAVLDGVLASSMAEFESACRSFEDKSANPLKLPSSSTATHPSSPAPIHVV